ncbi:putative Adenine nucleotide alpha hydrolases-like superfamily protein [Quillaja saponaria]|uniref:Adenine nucleotide alpha hydrolases-like superfamily protein n=1 Tax=Quillaja saponaria TaxID=32244 RepID=A0AAD7PHW5_QUISA|nr:putative Adenine nucleotide alpha hydrolases-like superfamily protein [Quillaja saponaria]
MSSSSSSSTYFEYEVKPIEGTRRQQSSPSNLSNIVFKTRKACRFHYVSLQSVNAQILRDKFGPWEEQRLILSRDACFSGVMLSLSRCLSDVGILPEHELDLHEKIIKEIISQARSYYSIEVIITGFVTVQTEILCEETEAEIEAEAETDEVKPIPACPCCAKRLVKKKLYDINGGIECFMKVHEERQTESMKGGTTPALKVMVVADPTRESAGALQYALSNVVTEHDEMILLHVGNPNSWRYTISTFLRRPLIGSSATTSSTEGRGGVGEYDFLEEMKKACEVAQPKVSVRTVRMETDRDKASSILYQANVHGVDLLVVGQRRSLSGALLGYRRPGGSMRGIRVLDTAAEYLIENSKCTCIAVQKKGQNAGYLLNTKTHRNFWLLA